MNLLTLTGTFAVEGDCTSEALDAHTDAIADELFDMEQSCPDLLDSALGVDLKNRIVEITVTVRTDSHDDGERVADSYIRAAIHASGGGTQGWGDSLKTTGRSSALMTA